MTSAASKPNPKPQQSFEFSVDGESYTTDDKTLTARQILSEFAQLDPATHYLIEIQGRHQDSYENRADEVIHMHPGQSFITAASGPTTVS